MGDDDSQVSLPMRRIAALWDWLPAFRAVAETENLRRAATFLALSPPALSRTLKLLEEAVGRALFVRDGRKLHLTEDGRRLLAAVRRAMRSIDEALDAPPEVLKVHAPPVLGPLVTRCLAAHEPHLRVVTRAVSWHELAIDLRRGALDLVLMSDAALAPNAEMAELVSAVVGAIPWVVLRAGDVAPRAVSLGPCDGWPPERPRTIAFEADDVASAIAAYERGLALALPAALAPHSDSVESVAPVRFIAIRRAPVGATSDRVGRALARLSESLGA